MKDLILRSDVRLSELLEREREREVVKRMEGEVDLGGSRNRMWESEYD